MMTRGIQAEQLAIEHVGDPSERVPVGNIESSERPTNVLERQAGLNVRIEGDVRIVIVVNESIAGGGIVERQGAGDEQQNQDGLLPAAGSPGICRLGRHRFRGFGDHAIHFKCQRAPCGVINALSSCCASKKSGVSARARPYAAAASASLPSACKVRPSAKYPALVGKMAIDCSTYLRASPHSPCS